MRVVAEAVIPAAPQAVWRAIVLWERQPAWMADAESVRVLTRQHEGVGVWIAATTRVLGLPVLSEKLEVTVWEPPRRLVVAHRSFIRGAGEWLLEPEGGSTRFGWTEAVSLPIPLLGEAALLVYRPAMRRLMRRSLSNLQALVRSEST